MSSTLIHDNPDDDRHAEDTMHEHHPRTTSSARSPINEEYDSDFDDSSHGDEEELTHKDSINEYEEQQSQIIVRINFLTRTYKLFKLISDSVTTTTDSLGNRTRMV